MSNAALNSRQIYSYVLGVRGNSKSPRTYETILVAPYMAAPPACRVFQPGWVIIPLVEYRSNQTFTLCGNSLILDALLSVE